MSTRFSINPDIARAETLPAEFYRSRAFFDESKQALFARSWQFLCDGREVAAPGQLLPVTLLPGMLDEPLLVSRDRNDALHVLSNVCTHRANILIEGACAANTIRCRYHGRRFGLDGACQFMPEFEGVQNFPSERDNLPQVQFREWRGFIFAALDNAPVFEEIFGEIERRVGWMPVEQFVYEPSLSREYAVRAHWALYCENYLEGFHIPYVHAGLSGALDYGQYTTELFEFANLQTGIASRGEICFELPQTSPDFGKNGAAYYFWVFPNLMLNFYPWGLSVNVVRPAAPELTKVAFLTYVWRPELLGAGAGAGLDRVEREDEAIVENVQKGIRSRLYDRGRYSAKRETGTHHFHRLIDRYFTTEPGTM